MKNILTYNRAYIDNGIEVAKKLGKLYVTYRKKFIEQYYNDEKDIITYKENKYPLKDSIILEHLTQQKTIGVYSGSVITSFMCFDIDVKDEQLSKWVVYQS